MITSDLGSRFGKFVLLLLVAAALAVIFGSPLFPTQDGPVHVYYADVAKNLLLRTGLYADALAINHYVSPYSLQTYLLVAFSFFAEPLMQEKLLIAVCLLLFVFGFRYLVQSVIPGDEVGPIWGMPFAFTYFIYSGTYNFCLSVGIALWVIGFWTRHCLRLTVHRSLQFAGLMILLVLAHPVSYGLALLFCGIQLLWVMASMGSGLRAGFKSFYRPIAHLGAAACLLGWILTFVTGDSRSGLSASVMKTRFADYVMMWAITPVATRPYRYALSTVVLASGLAAVWGLLRSSRVKGLLKPPAYLVFGLICMVLAFFSPARVSGGTNIGTRVFLIGALLTIAAGAVVPLASKLRIAGSLLAGVLSLAFFFQLHIVNSRVSEKLRVFREAPVAGVGDRIAYLSSYSHDDPVVNAYPHFWFATHYILRSKAIFANYGFLYLTYENLKPAHAEKCQGLDPAELPDRPSMARCLADAANDPDRPRIDVIVSTIPAGFQVAEAYGLHLMPYSTAEVQFFGR